MNDMHTLSHSSWNYKYHETLPRMQSILRGETRTQRPCDRKVENQADEHMQVEIPPK